MAAAISVPIYMRVGGGAELQVGDVEVPVSGDGTMTLRRTQLAAALRSAADHLDAPSAGDVPGPGT
ncbi:hypothetical protein QBA57_39655 [Streptomyces scabiei]|uniref:hypothetical protein n=1 Tax=Streptomyces scabiei TaxID=1930 RepID=UPI0029A4ECEB|nr:hypothetical protein [Streptomyces scabiei]MDX2566088.1 hypothetical protein [Streptomyces scabiei]MDX3149632.1 hypothetical protein [Streptomyces scabiei]MDX3161397.1 hypothetical protein [Streptomyces scabiei]MDX3161405.1 hypothetical protein [Streptomyces scabiei]MDX3288128.1 hypothetical protein [Streptomyces scabiei]